MRLILVSLFSLIVVLSSIAEAIVVTDSASVRAALIQRHDNIELEGLILVDPRHFRQAAAITSKSVTFTSASGQAGILDFGGTSDVIYVASGGELRLKNHLVRGLALPNSRGAPADSTRLWPSIQLAPRAKLVLESCNVEYPRHDSFNSCASHQKALVSLLHRRHPRSKVQIESPSQLHIAEFAATDIQLSSYGQHIGTAFLSLRNLTLVCSEEGRGTCEGNCCAADQGDASGLSAAVFLLRAEAVAVSLGILLLAAAIMVCCLVAEKVRTQRHYKLRLRVNKEVADEKYANLQAFHRSIKGSDDSHSDEVHALLSTAGSSLYRRASGCGIGCESPRPSSITEGSLYGVNHAQLLKMRLEGGLEGIEKGPLLGRGSYGRVFKGRWRGALVAIKVVEHDMEGSAIVVDGARESLLAASVAHPNVVACFKIVTVAVHRRDSQTDADGFPVATTSADSSKKASGTTTSIISPADAQAHVVANVAARSSMARTSSLTHTLTTQNSGDQSNLPILSPTAAQVEPEMEQHHQIDSSISSKAGEVMAEALYLSDPMRGNMKRSRSGNRSSEALFVPPEVEIVLDPDLRLAQEQLAELKGKSIETWMLLEYADRGSLDAAVAAKRFHLKSDPSQLDLVSVCRTLLDVVNGMLYLHGLGLLHADLKPQNILLKSTSSDPRGFIAKLADFGLSRMLDANATHVSTQTFGTVPFMPPELLSSGRMAKPADVYSFAIIMWQMFAGTIPHQGMTTMQVMYNVVHQRLRLEVPSAMPPAYAAIMKACWQEDPENRPAFQVVHHHLSRLLEAELSVRLSDRREKAMGSASMTAAVRESSGSSAAKRSHPVLENPHLETNLRRQSKERQRESPQVCNPLTPPADALSSRRSGERHTHNGPLAAAALPLVDECYSLRQGCQGQLCTAQDMAAAPTGSAAWQLEGVARDQPSRGASHQSPQSEQAAFTIPRNRSYHPTATVLSDLTVVLEERGGCAEPCRRSSGTSSHRTNSWLQAEQDSYAVRGQQPSRTAVAADDLRARSAPCNSRSNVTLSHEGVPSSVRAAHRVVSVGVRAVDAASENANLQTIAGEGPATVDGSAAGSGGAYATRQSPSSPFAVAAPALNVKRSEKSV